MTHIQWIEPMRARISANLAARIVGGRKELKRLIDQARPNFGEPILKNTTIYETRPHFTKLIVEPKGLSNHYFLCDTVPSGEYLKLTLAPFEPQNT